MATLNISHTFFPSTAAVASQVNDNFADVKTFAEALAAGTNIDTGAITYASLATAAVESIVNTAIATGATSDQSILSSQVFG